MLHILGYPSRYSAAPGEAIDFHISAENGQDYEASLVRVICGDCNPEGPGLRYEQIPNAIDGHYRGRRQSTDAGSYMRARIRGLDEARALSFFAFLWPTLPARDDQTIIRLGDKKAGIRLFMAAGGKLELETWNGGKHLRRKIAKASMLPRQWYRVHFSLDLVTGAASFSHRPVRRYAQVNDEGAFEGKMTPVTLSSTEAFIAGSPTPSGQVDMHFDGKIDGPMLLSTIYPQSSHDALINRGFGGNFFPDMVAHWDFSKEISSVMAFDVSGNDNHASLVNAPTRAMKGWNWSGDHHRWTERPDQYGAIHFHHDDLYDAGWEKSFSLVIPRQLRSGAYAVRVRSGKNTPEGTRDFYIPFFVRPPRRAPHSKGQRDRIAFLAPTASYIAYANHAEHITAREAERTIGRLLEFGHIDLYMHAHPEIGGSLYDSHKDGSGVCYSSRLRPVLNFTSQYHSWLGGHGSALWQYNADIHLIAWMEQKKFTHDVITDEDMHDEGAFLLEDYRVLITGTHPEYYSTAMWNALKTWIDQGGRLMYLGANGFYWHIAFSKDMPGMIEVRRAEDGIRTWMAEPGEYYHSFSGEQSGLYRRRGHAPNELCGVGFIAQGFDISSYYRRAPDADNPRANFIFEGISDEIIGDFGLIGGGAAGLELDCITTELGSPPNALRLATSENHSQQVMLVNEEFGVVPPNLGGDQNARVRADLCFFETPAGGAVFSTGSISWCGSLLSNNADNNVSRLTENVLRRFSDPEPFE